MTVRRPSPIYRRHRYAIATALVVAVGVAVVTTSEARAATVHAQADAEGIKRALGVAQPGDTIVVPAGQYPGGLVIDKSVTLEGREGAVINGGGTGRVLTVDAPDTVVRGMTVTGSGNRLDIEDSGIFVTAKAERALIENNRVIGNLIGIYLKGPKNAVVRGNTVQGRSDLRLNERGNGIHLWNTPGSIIEDNHITSGRDGIFVTTSKKNTFRRNRIEDVRFAVHYMYANDSEVSGNISNGNHLGYAIMFSNRIRVVGNVSSGDRDRGFLLNYANKSLFEDNLVRGGPEKCVFIYNANRNEFRDNRFEQCAIGIHFTAGSEHNVLTGNTFSGNREQVKYVGTRLVEWSSNGRGNYWSDNLGVDLNADGIADAPYRPNDIIDQIVWRHPSAKLLLNSPAFQVLRWAQSAFKGLYPGGVRDSHPLMVPPKPEKGEG